MRVEIVRSPVARLIERRTLELPEDATVEQALRACGWTVSGAGVGGGGRRCGLQQALREGDRIELYRPLQIDPKEARRARGHSQRPPRRR